MSFSRDTQQKVPGPIYNYARRQGALTNAYVKVYENDTDAVVRAQVSVTEIAESGAITFHLRFVKAGDSSGGSGGTSTNDFEHNTALAASEKYTVPEELVLADGDALWMKASANSSANYYIALIVEE